MTDSAAPYSLGVDLGTTYTAAAIRRGDRLEIVDLGTRHAVIPSVVYLRPDGEMLTGEAAVRRGTNDPTRLAREFKRRMGDTTAIVLGGSPYSVDALMASVLRGLVATVVERQGGPPHSIAIAHPANWGQYKKDLLVEAVKRADLDDAVLVTEPQAAAVHYATLERLDTGATVAVYDLGGGTFDAAVVRKSPSGFELLGQPEGIERLGGIDFDEAVFRHAVAALGAAIDDLDMDDAVAQAAMTRLRDECVAAKEALSSDTETSIPVLLPNVNTEVRLTRAEFEAMIRPALADTLVVLRRALRSASVEPGDLDAVLLVGGSSRIPLISQMVGAELERPVALDVHPKHSVALGAAVLADHDADLANTPTALPQPVLTEPTVTETPEDQPTVEADAVPPSPPGAAEATSRRSRTVVAGTLGVTAVAVAGWLVFADRGQGDATTMPTSVSAPTTAAAWPSSTELVTPSSTTNAPAVLATSPTTPQNSPNPCGEVVDEPCITIDGLRVTPDGAIEVTWSPHGFLPDVVDGFHAHLYWNDATAAQASNGAVGQVPWDAVDQVVHTSSEVLTLSRRPPDATGVCATVGIAPAHTAYNPELFHCIELPGD